MAKQKYYTHVQPYLKRIPIWKRQGMTDEQIAVKLGIDGATLYDYKNKHPEFSECFKTGRAELMEDLEETLFTRAKGKEYEEIKTYIEHDSNGKEKKRVEKTKKTIHSDACLIFALKNLDRNKWRDKQDIEHSGVTEVIFVDDLDDVKDKDIIKDDEGGADTTEEKEDY